MCVPLLFLYGISGSLIISTHSKIKSKQFLYGFRLSKGQYVRIYMSFQCGEYFHFSHWPCHVRQANSCWFYYALPPPPLLLQLHNCWCCFSYTKEKKKKFKPNSNNRNNQLERIPLHKFLKKRKRNETKQANWIQLKRRAAEEKNRNAIRWVDTNLNNLKWSLYFTPTECIIQSSKLLLVFFFHKLFVILWKAKGEKCPRNVENERKRKWNEDEDGEWEWLRAWEWIGMSDGKYESQKRLPISS